MAARLVNPRVGIVAAAIAITAGLPASTGAADGTFELAWGRDVDQAGSTGFEICLPTATCKAGVIGGLGGEFDGPEGVATDGAGNVYVADQFNNRIQKFDSSGTFLRAWGKDVDQAGGSGFEICASSASCKPGLTGGLGGELDEPLGVATDAAGNVYVSDFGNQRIQKFDSSGTFLRAWGADVDQAGGAGFEICTPPGICKAGVGGALGGELDGPNGVATDGTNVYVADQSNNRIQRFDSSGTFLRAWGKDVDQDDAGTDFEICIPPATCQAGATGGLGGELITPFGVAADGVGDVYVADKNNIRVQKFASSGTFLRAWGKDVDQAGGTGPEVCTVAASCKGSPGGGLAGEFSFVADVATDAAGNVYVADGANNWIQVFDSSGAFARAWGRNVDEAGGTGFEICTVAASCKAGTNGVLGGELDFPGGVAADTSGDVYVVDQNNLRVQKFGDPDTIAPDLALEAKRKQSLGKPVKVKVSCDEACEVLAEGTAKPKGSADPKPKRAKKLNLKPASASLAAGEQRLLKLKPSKRAAKKLKRAAKATAKLAVTATDAAGNEAHAALKVKLR